ncbi:MAG: hypothetical protein OEV91_04650, partial [Desulfobulbaceae bacterium]|nr:hypothetical protein [Desulfobulbaceae bacterium]
DQTMVMKGNILRKVALPVTVQPRPRQRQSRSVIKAEADAPLPPQPVAEVPVEGGGGRLAEEVVEAAAGLEEVVAEAAPVVEEVGGVAGPAVAEPTPPQPVAEAVPAPEAEAEAEVEHGGVPEEGAPAAGVAPVGPEVSELSSAELDMDGVEAAVAVAGPATEEAARAAEEIFAAAGVASETAAVPVAEEVVAAPAPVDDSGLEGGGMLCPVCRQGRILDKRTPTGKTFYVCPRGDCEFMAWAPPHDLPCQVCGSLFLVEKKDLRGRPFLRCPKAGCNFRQPLPGDEGSDLARTEMASPRRKVLVRRVAKGGAATGKTRKVLVRRRK